MKENRDEWIKKRAYAIWEEEGYPTGRDAVHWEQAVKEHVAMQKTAPHGLEVKPKTRAKVKAPKVAGNGAVAQEVVAKRAPRKTASAKA